MLYAPFFAASASCFCFSLLRHKQSQQSTFAIYHYQRAWKRLAGSVHRNWKLLRAAIDRDSAAWELVARIDGTAAEKPAVHTHDATF